MKLKQKLFLLVAGASVIFAACSQEAQPTEVAHTESDKRGLLGGQKHTEDTTYQNPDGTYSHQHEETKVK